RSGQGQRPGRGGDLLCLLHPHAGSERGVPRLRRAPPGLARGAAAVWPRHERGAAEPARHPDVHPYSSALQHGPGAVRDAVRLPARREGDQIRPGLLEGVDHVIIVMGHTATEGEINAVVDRVHEIGLKTELSRGEERTLIGVIGANAYAYREAFSHLSGIHEIIPITKPFKLASREFRSQNTVVDVGGVKI